MTHGMSQITTTEITIDNNMGLLGRFFSTRDMRVIGSFNAELMGDVIQTQVFIYKICAAQTKANVYGESSQESGKIFYPGVECTCLIDRADIDTTFDEFGSDRNQTVVFKFREENLKLVNIYPENGDIISFNQRYHEIDNVVQEQFLGGVSDKSWSIICNTHYSRLSKLSLVERQV
jgi:hypothetical protein